MFVGSCAHDSWLNEGNFVCQCGKVRSEAQPTADEFGPGKRTHQDGLAINTPQEIVAAQRQRRRTVWSDAHVPC